MKRIPLLSGGHAIVDDGDHSTMLAYRWTRSMNGKTAYAVRFAGKRGRQTIYMHREILGASRAQFVDHMNHDGLDNRRANLRLCSHSENAANSTAKPGVTGFRGVYAAPGGKFRARVWVNGVAIEAGRLFDSAEEAAHARDAIARNRFGAFAKLNLATEGKR